MAKYPDWTVGTDVSAANLALGIPDYYVKAASSTKANNTFADDTELAGIALGVGTFHVRLFLFAHCTGSATPDIKTQWTFSGTWNNPLRMCIGPSSTNTGGRDALTPMKMSAEPAATSVSYGLAASSGFTCITEESMDVTVTVAGNLALQWAQVTTDAVNVTTVQSRSAFIIKQRAA